MDILQQIGSHLTFITRRRIFPPWAVLTALLPALASGHETDQFTVPIGSEFVDLRFYVSDEIYKKIDSAVNKVNRRIKRSMESGPGKSPADVDQEADKIESAVYAEFPSFVYHVQVWELKVPTGKNVSRAPGMVIAYRPVTWIYHDWALLIDITKLVRLVRTSTIMVDGTYFGTDKLSHFFDMGYRYFLAYKRNREDGIDEEEAAARAVSLSTGRNPIYSEGIILGGLTTGIRSNGDLAANYVGMKFFLNLTEEVRLKGILRPPMLVRDGVYWKLNDHVKPNSDFFSVFISDHYDEALNPNYYVMVGMSDVMRKQVKKRCDDVLKWYIDDEGNPLSKTQFMDINKELSTYYGEDYGHERDFDNIVSVANVCFDDEPPDEDGDEFVDRMEGPADPAGDPPTTEKTNSDAQADRAILSRNETIDDTDKFGRTAVWRAARHGNLDQVKELINQGAGLDIRDIDGEGPLHAASRWGWKSIAQLLLKNGVDPNTGSRYGLAPLHLAVREMDADLVKILLEHGGDPNVHDVFGCTPLHDLSARGDGELAELLVATGADPAARDMNGTTPLHRAARAGNDVMVKKLLSLGADARSVNLLGKTPIDEALQADHRDLSEYLSTH